MTEFHSSRPERILVTGASGLVGGAALRRLVAQSEPTTRFIALVRHHDWEPDDETSGRGGIVIPLRGDVTLPNLGLSMADWDALRDSVTGILHCAATTRFSTPIEDAARVNIEGTKNVLRLARLAPGLRRFTHVSTAFVAGRRVGMIQESDLRHTSGFVNTYEETKYEAEILVSDSGLPWSIARLGAILGSAATGNVHQMNGVYCVLRAYYDGLVPVLAGYEGTPVDLISEELAADALVHLFEKFVPETTVHICAGLENSLTVRQFFEVAAAAFAQANVAWPDRHVPLPQMVGKGGYAAFEDEVRESGQRDCLRVVQHLKHFVPQLLYPKAFDRALGAIAMSSAGISCPPAAHLLHTVAVRHAEKMLEREGIRPEMWGIRQWKGRSDGRSNAL